MEMRLPRSVVEIIDGWKIWDMKRMQWADVFVTHCWEESRRIGISRLRQNRKPSKKRLTGRLIRASSTVPLLL